MRADEDRLLPGRRGTRAAGTGTPGPARRGRFGIGTGEALNEHILGDPWPELDERLAMLEESVEVMRELWTGRNVNHRGPHHTVSGARIYTRPEHPPPVYLSAFGPKAARTAGGEGKPCQLGTKVCFGTDEAAARRTAHRLWPNIGLPGEQTQVLPKLH